MTNQALKFEDFETEKLTKNQQKTVLGGDPTQGPTEPGRGTGIGSL